MIKDVSKIFLVCSFSIFQEHIDPVWSSARLVTQHIDGVPIELCIGIPPPLCPPQLLVKKFTKKGGGGVVIFLNCIDREAVG
jgi:hypothetical protein